MSKITLKEVEKAKAEYKNIYVVEVDMNEKSSLSDQFQEEGEEEDKKIDTSGELAEGDNIFRAILKKPEKRILGLAMTSKDPIQMGNIILKNCIIKDGNESLSDAEILENDDVNVTAALQVIKFISLGQGKLKKF